MKTVILNKQKNSASRSGDFLFIDESDGIFDDNWIVSANDLFGSFNPIGEGPDMITFYDRAA
ncbi:hypothetical protein G8759_28665 [Spirosoma aureum]|uniref:Uncharacterized protein n=1 Tax=Spirosoma aureum TaxID=2692134 RepID=A0A6G9AVD4_9BACT|nr:hypothetical protein [Spirosoma aureum]QIP16328.1 hypothetical protein G8759_28665 [Spirosoma aureum]